MQSISTSASASTSALVERLESSDAVPAGGQSSPPGRLDDHDHGVPRRPGRRVVEQRRTVESSAPRSRRPRSCVSPPIGTRWCLRAPRSAGGDVSLPGLEGDPRAGREPDLGDPDGRRTPPGETLRRTYPEPGSRHTGCSARRASQRGSSSPRRRTTRRAGPRARRRSGRAPRRSGCSRRARSATARSGSRHRRRRATRATARARPQRAHVGRDALVDGVHRCLLHSSGGNPPPNWMSAQARWHSPPSGRARA